MSRNTSLCHAISVVTLALLLSLGLGCAHTQREQQAVDARIEKKARAHYDLGIDHLNKGRAAMGLQELLKSEALAPDDPWTHMGLAEAYRQQGHPDKALTHLERALAISPDLQSARLNLSGVYIQLQRYEDAAREAQTLANDPTFPTPWRALTNLGWAQLRLGRVQEARRSLEMAVEYHENYWPALLNLGILESEQGRPLDAIALFDRVLAQRPEAPSLARAETNYRLAEIYIALGQQERAVQYLTAAVERKPSGSWGKKSQEYLNLLH